jgi:hypothetical protein
MDNIIYLNKYHHFYIEKEMQHYEFKRFKVSLIYPILKPYFNSWISIISGRVRYYTVPVSRKSVNDIDGFQNIILQMITILLQKNP